MITLHGIRHGGHHAQAAALGARKVRWWNRQSFRPGLGPLAQCRRPEALACPEAVRLQRGLRLAARPRPRR